MKSGRGKSDRGRAAAEHQALLGTKGDVIHEERASNASEMSGSHGDELACLEGAWKVNQEGRVATRGVGSREQSAHSQHT